MDYSKPFLGKIVQVKIDRPIGSKHPKFKHRYKLNYGFIQGTNAPDGDEVDAYVLGELQKLESFSGRCIAIIHRTNDDDDKLIVCEDGKQFSDEEIRQATEFQEKWFKSEIIR